MPAWIDRSSHSRTATDRTPNAWELRAGKARIVVHRLHGADGWFTSLHGLEFSQSSLKSESPDDAKREAIRKVISELRASLDILEGTA